MSALAPERSRQSPPVKPKSTPPKLHLITRAAPSVRVSRAPKAPFVTLLLLLLGGGLMGLLLLNTVIDQDAFTLHDLQSKQTALDVQEAALHETADSDADPAALAAKAAALGMVPAGPPIFVTSTKLPKGGKLVGNLYIVMGKPTPPPVASPAAAAAVAAPVATAKATATTATTATPGTTARTAAPLRSASTTRTAVRATTGTTAGTTSRTGTRTYRTPARSTVTTTAPTTAPTARP